MPLDVTSFHCSGRPPPPLRLQKPGAGRLAQGGDRLLGEHPRAGRPGLGVALQGPDMELGQGRDQGSRI